MPDFLPKGNLEAENQGEWCDWSEATTDPWSGWYDKTWESEETPGWLGAITKEIEEKEERNEWKVPIKTGQMNRSKKEARKTWITKNK